MSIFDKLNQDDPQILWETEIDDIIREYYDPYLLFMNPVENDYENENK